MILLLILFALLAFANGANDNCKGVATLVGYGVTTPRRAMIWAMVSTLAGAIMSFWFAGGLVKSFSTGLFAKGAPLTGAFFVAVLVGAFAWIIFATRTGLPVSTTHAITGALAGAGIVQFGVPSLQWMFLATKFALPLLLSPILAMTIVYLLAWPIVYAVQRYQERCICVVKEEAALVTSGAALVGGGASTLTVISGTESSCATESTVATASASSVAIGLHWFSSGLIGFARGWNDAPKIAALALVGMASAAHGTAISFAVVAIAMAIGGLVAGLRVLDTLARKVTPLPLAESLTASMSTAVLVGLASWNGLPVSTTHVSTGAIVGAGLKNDPHAVRWKKVGEIVLSWVVTLPVAALIAAGAALVTKRF